MGGSTTTGMALLDIAVLLLAARTGGTVLERMGQPRVIGEILAGVALGPTLLGALPGDPSAALFPDDARATVALVGQVGLALFMFTLGWDLSLGLLRRRERVATAVSIGSVALPAVLGLALAAYLYPGHQVVDATEVSFWPFAVFLAASLSLTALPVLTRILNETGRAGTEVGTLVVAAAAVNDVIGWSLLGFALTLLASGGAWEYGRIVIETGLFAGGVVLLGRPLFRRLLADGSAGRETLLVSAALGGAVVTQTIGIHAVFGAFIVGVAMPRRGDQPGVAELQNRLLPAVRMLVPIYFVMSGMGIDLGQLRPADLGALAMIVAVACSGKFVGAFAGARAAGMGTGDAVTVGILMNTRGLIEIVLLTAGRDYGVIDDRLFAQLATMAILTTLLTPLALRVQPALGRLGARAPRPVIVDQRAPDAAAPTSSSNSFV